VRLVTNCCWRQAREFRANPLKTLTPVLPRKQVPPTTKPVPFELEVDVRGAAKADEFKKQVMTDDCWLFCR